MKRLFIFITTLAFVSLTCNALTSATPAISAPETSATSTPNSQPVPSATSIPSSTFDSSKLGTPERDVTYCTMEGVELKMDIRYPRSTDGRWPVAMYVHGGGWTGGDKKGGAGAEDISGLQKAGFLVVSVNYRLAPEYKFPAMIEDVKCAVRFLRARAAEYNLDPDHIGAWGSSAGGHLVALLGLADESAGWDVGEYLEYSSRVQAVVDMFGPADLTVPFSGGYDNLKDTVFGGFDAALASPVTYATPGDPPFLILHGDKDELVPITQSKTLLARLQAERHLAIRRWRQCPDFLGSPQISGAF